MESAEEEEMRIAVYVSYVSVLHGIRIRSGVEFSFIHSINQKNYMFHT